MRMLISFANFIDKFNQRIGISVAWLALFMVLIQFSVVILRYAFGYSSIFMQESIIYMHGFLFLLGASYTLLHDGHVRVDIFYREASPKKKAITNIFGVFVFLIPVCISFLVFSLPYIANSWKIFESSKETSGIPAVYILKSAIIAFCLLIILQGISMAIHSLAIILGNEKPSAIKEHEGI